MCGCAAAPRPAKKCRSSSRTARADEQADNALARLAGLLAKFADPSTPYYSLLHPMWTTHYGTYDHLARVQEWSLIGGANEDEAGE